MATDLHPARPAPAPKKHEVFVETQLARARTRIRSLDLAAAGLGLLILTLAYGLLLALCDRWLELSPLVRQTALALYSAGALVYLGLLVLRPLFRRINPYYAARRLEETIPEAKNSVVNWLDLHQQPIAPAFRAAIGHQAARDLRAADLEQAISARRASWLGAAAMALFVCLLILFVLGPRQFLSLMNRAFAPFVEAPIATRTRLVIVRPEGGDITIPVGRAVSFSVWVEGRIPEASSPQALRLLYRYNPGDPYQTRPLERGESSWEWFTNLLASEVHNGFWYRVAGGDVQTPEYRVQVRSSPLFTGFDVAYHYRPYLDWPDRRTHDQNLQDLRGTEVTLLARTNRTVSDGQLVIDGQKPIAAELVAEDPQALRFHLRLEKDGTYRIRFRSVEAERNIDPMAYTIRVLLDHPPQIELTKPGEDSQLPANGVLHLEGSASDDFGLVSLNLRMKMEEGTLLKAKPYRNGEALRRGDGSYPQVLAYRDFIELDKVQKEDGQALAPLGPGSKLEYWLEAKDNCDYPGPNIGESKHFKVTIQPPATDQKKQEQERPQADQEQQKHEQKQDQDLQNQKREPPDRPPEQNSAPHDANAQGKEGENQNEDELNQQKDKIENAIKKHEQEQQSGGKGESQANPSQQSKAEGKGEGNSTGQPDKAQNQDKEAGKGKPQPGQDKVGSKPETGSENRDPKGEGQSTSKPEGDQGNTRKQEGTQRRPDQPAAQGSKSEQTQQEGANQAGKNSEARPKPKEDGQQPDKATPQLDSGNNGDKSNRTENQAGGKANADRKQNNGQNQQSGSNSQGEQKKGPEEKAAQANAGQKQAGPKEQDSGQRPNGGTGEKEQKQTSSQDKPNQTGADKKPGTGAEKSDKNRSGQDGSRQEAGPKAEPKPGANAEKGEQNKQDQQAGQQGGQKQANGNAGQQADKSQRKEVTEPRADKTGGAQGESKPEDQGAAQSKRKTDGGPGDGDKSKPADKNRSAQGAGENAVKSEEKPAAEDKSGAVSRATTGTEKQDNTQNPAAKGAQGADKAQDKGKTGTSSAPDSARPQQPKPGSQSAAKPAEELKENVSALSEALRGSDEKAREGARKKLEELREKANDPAVREAAADALERAGRDGSEKSAQKAAGTKPGDRQGRPEGQAASKSDTDVPGREERKPGEQSAAGQKGTEQGTRQTGTPKGERKNADPWEAKPDPGSEKGERGKPADSSGQPGGAGTSRSRGGNEPNGPTPQANDRRDDVPDQRPDRVEPPTPPNAEYKKRPGELQLDDIKKRINKDVLKDLSMTEEDFNRFVKAYQEMLKRKQPAAADKENLAGPQRGNRAQPNQKVRLVDPREQGKESNLQRQGPVPAPPEFREAYKEFSKRISEPEQTKEKQ
jgi:hypothetical protein